MSQISPVLISDLMIDVNNPRLPTPALGQREALRELAKHQGRKLVALAEDIAANGLNPADLLIVMPFPNSNSRYVVLEGNRRFVTLKCLEAPDTLNDNGMDAKILTEIRRLSKLYQESPIDYVQCCVCDSRDEAKHWIGTRSRP